MSLVDDMSKCLHGAVVAHLFPMQKVGSSNLPEGTCYFLMLDWFFVDGWFRSHLFLGGSNPFLTSERI